MVEESCFSAGRERRLLGVRGKEFFGWEATRVRPTTTAMEYLQRSIFSLASPPSQIHAAPSPQVRSDQSLLQSFSLLLIV